ncbi:bifunctional tRNA (5-methylaminomethyl-2-thiouridylate)-methyltransferase MnmD/FAD-dependent cmnm(5)s(2)U34 oxidoreductase MnmC [[Haemophilus] ducreyi]|uniref:bifunctional tRNA (5-methylaminomethyl-2-thiouridine)(34)-methyltransferase MnmD/FAD-dependent 5-carboxymethylaminomethyl-2-thiouridine(34) oxidoreductase MnmC n=1 Tax=Haemophilus ducreyi TaxID=730 RepID=UPI0007CDF435|nr:bifunctional tRNA (5-methylaminomethyl-2-thiouridine)(34)-methyltransferase MnmD/FAD-dependent 5-carboxymethylaminomethyl-2-thiouridine(34) oxidoreductase MnmC [[Haemophilus] ducreyi]ANF61412.1 bifunctional tRNA (5-methylaminomethyl-2-thiouridylate)-methyltransferase MnmD/FAD-dependent cmnm(5)s(2)U34 oxidoreductase MnmC [[Haemophilus] ducreyi]ANF67662.1 bifunctional tRNA (5-methylaminomethyl-2-thiouridylate)-methyltransferase MnmD/FAD-dependent cmnm(5)s(2)U34 oxidoreductase MnmC [[Haemophilus]
MHKLTFAQLSFNSDNTPVSEQFDDIYFSTEDGVQESYYVFQDGNQLWQKWQNHHRSAFVIAETGFGTELNFLAVAEKFQQFRSTFPDSPLKLLYFISFEKYPLTQQQLADIHQHYPQFTQLSAKLIACWQPRQAGCQRYHFDDVYLDIWFGEMLENLPQLGDLYSETVDAWFLDGFSPDKNPTMWHEQLYQHMFRLTRVGGSFATFTAASHVRRGLQAVGFTVYKRKGFAKKREMLCGEKAQESQTAEVNFPYFYSQPATVNDDIAIVGGGIASLFVALSLLERGKQVTLYCQDSQVAQKASGNAQGAIYPQLSDDDPRNVRFYVHCFDYALQRLKQFEKLVPFEHALTGVVLSAYNEKTAQKLQKIARQTQDQDLFKWCQAEELTEYLGVAIANEGAFIPQAGWLSPVQFVQQAFAYLQTKGLKIVLNHTVTDPQFVEGKWQWQYQGVQFAHHILVLANGHSFTQFSQAEGIPLYPVRGQVSQIPTTPALQKLKCVICYDGYLTPMATNGYHCIGASHVRDNTDMAFSAIEHQQNLAKLQQNIGAYQWTQGIDLSANLAKQGIRAALRDRVPMVGPIPHFAVQKQQYSNIYNLLRRKQAVENAVNFPHLYMVNGLASRGLTTAPLLGEMLASLIVNEPIPISQDIWHALLPNRTWLRKWLKGSNVV